MTDYTTAEAVRERIKKVSANDDAVIGLVITAMSRMIDRYCNRPDGYFKAATTATARLYMGSGKPTQRIDDCVEITAVAVKESVTDTTYTTWAADDYLPYRGDERNPDFNGLPYTGLMVLTTGDQTVFTAGIGRALVGFPPRQLQETVAYTGEPTVRVTAKWGYAVDVPAQIEQACIVEVARAFKRGESAFQDATAGEGFGALIYQQELDKSTKAILVSGRFVRPSVG